jgi:hypothetical protein
LVIHGLVDDKQPKKKRKKLPIISNESLELEISNFDDGSDSKPLSKYMSKALGKMQDGRKD